MPAQQGHQHWALLSMRDKSGLVDFARGLDRSGFGILASGGTARHLGEAGLPVIPLEEVTGFATLLGGRVKTLHPLVHAGILARRDRAEDMAQLGELGARPIDLVAVNLYPFRETVAAGAGEQEVLEMIDIGGPALLRAAAKNHRHVLVVCSPQQYGEVLAALAGGALPPPEAPLRRRLAQVAFQHTMAYDYAVAGYLATGPTQEDGAQAPAVPGAGAPAAGELPAELYLGWQRVRHLRYGENPHQKAAFYIPVGRPPVGLGAARVLQGKELSYNNMLDVHAAWALVSEFDPSRPACVAVKHAGPCGCSLGSDALSAYRRARDADPVSVFGGIVAFNVSVDEEAAAEMTHLFLEVVVAPSFTPEARWHLARKENLRLVEMPAPYRPEAEFRQVWGGLLWQELGAPAAAAPATEWRVVTVRRPTTREMEDLRFAWKVVKHVRSNAIVLAHGGATTGIGQGQPNRVDAARLAIGRAGPAARGSVMASDGFFPFPDTVEEAVRAGVTAIVQPGGSLKDDQSIAACDRAGLAMVFTGVRHFLH
ncbi:MAG TPA: bifunctional phosphoribosylaminoimidazolecarboxamide formyltransferase/IMP cyclohydrolase [Firmicutes bacterium]|nr:bifunctional phosphoribosylaminoimidazolecarboxamide formyltransferase/IMP cyclohydrolase [Bacillota bacterium]